MPRKAWISGRVRVGGGRPWVGPEGHVDEPASSSAQMPGAPLGQLLGRIDSGYPFAINGTSREIRMPESGRLSFGVNDSWAGDNDGEFENLTPAIQIAGGTWGFRGFIYLNAEHFQSRGASGRNATIMVPGEPFQDKDGNGVRDTGENWINLNFNGISAFGDEFRAEAADNFGGSVSYNAIGPTFTDTANLAGVRTGGR